jgi:transposase
MIPETRMTEQQSEKLQAISKEFPKTGRAFRMVQSLDTMYRCERYEDGKVVFNKLISWLRRSRLEPMKQVANTLKNTSNKFFPISFTDSQTQSQRGLTA